MRIEQFKRWHWALIGLALGLAVSLWRGMLGVDWTVEHIHSSLEPSEFEKLLAMKTLSGKPVVKDIRVYKMSDGSYCLSAQQLVAATSGASRVDGYVPVRIPAKTPYIPKDKPESEKIDPNFTVIDYLRQVREKNPQITYSTGWWDREPMRSTVFAPIGMVLLAAGGPALVHSLLGAGLGRTPEKKEPEYDLSRFGKDKPQSKEPVKKGPSEQDLAHLRELEAELEQRLASRTDAGDAPPGSAPAGSAEGAKASASQTDQPLRKLDGGPLEAQVDDTPKKQKRYGGEFYPTETHVKPEDK